MALPKKKLAVFLHSLATQLDAGIALREALDLQRTSQRGGMRRWVEDLAAGLDRSQTLSESIRTASVQSPQGLSEIVRAGERTGRLDHALRMLAADYERQVQLTSRALAKSMYPMLLLVVALGLGCLLSVLADMGGAGAARPGNASTGMSATAQYLVTVIVAVGVLGISVMAFRTWKPHYWFGALPLWPGLVRLRSRMQFFQGMAMAVASGILMDEAVRIGGRMVAHPAYRKRLMVAADKVLQAHAPPSVVLAEADLFERTELEQLAVMEHAGALDEALGRLARNTEDRFASAMTFWVMLLSGLLLAAVMVYALYFILSFWVGLYGSYPDVRKMR